MPQGNGTGPSGMGPMTGRAAGFCAGNGQAGFMSSATRRSGFSGRGRGRNATGSGLGGFGRGCRNMFFATGQPGWMRSGNQAPPVISAATETEKQELKKRAATLQAELNDINQRLS